MNLLRAVVRLVVALFRFVFEWIKLSLGDAAEYERKMNEVREFFRDPEEAAADKRRADAILRDYFL